MVSDRRLKAERPDDPNHFPFEIVSDRRLKDLTVSTHFPFEMVRDRRLNGLEAVLRNLTVPITSLSR